MAAIAIFGIIKKKCSKKINLQTLSKVYTSINPYKIVFNRIITRKMTMNISTKYAYDLEYLYDNGYLHYISKKI